MNSAPDAIRAGFTRVVALTWRGVYLNLIMVALVVASLAVRTYHRPFPRTGVLNGVIVTLAGVQLWIADGQFTRLGTDRRHGWVRPVAAAFLVAGAVFVALGISAFVHRAAAT